MRSLTNLAVAVALMGAAASLAHAQDSHQRPGRTVLVELYTSQGCDMCPDAERLLGQLAEQHDRIVPIAFHVDYFNDPWKDPFSDALYSQRQAAYNAVYTKPKDPEYGLYYTPMLMIDGAQSVNGRDPNGAEAAIRRALARPPEVELNAKLELEADGRSGRLNLGLTAKSSAVQNRNLLVCAVVRDDRITTRVTAGENANKALLNRFPARATKFEFIRLRDASEKQLAFPLRLEGSWKAGRVNVVVFVQDKESGVVYQAAAVPWKTRPEK